MADALGAAALACSKCAAIAPRDCVHRTAGSRRRQHEFVLCIGKLNAAVDVDDRDASIGTRCSPQHDVLARCEPHVGSDDMFLVIQIHDAPSAQIDRHTIGVE